jgi:hypothetical protein
MPPRDRVPAGARGGLSDGTSEVRRQHNADAVDRIVRGHPFWVDLLPAIDAIPGMRRDLILHAGPPLSWDEMVPPMQAAIAGALVLEGLSEDLEAAAALAASGRIAFAPAHDFRAVGPMAGIISPSMPVFVVRNETFGNSAFASVNEGLGKALRFGANDRTVLARLRWIRDVLAPALAAAVRRRGPLDLRELVTEALHRGDECHNRNKAATALFLTHIASPLVRSASADVAATCLDFIGGNDHFFLNLSMAHSKSVLDPAQGIHGSTVVTAMAGNGVRFGLRVAGLGTEWITAPAEVPNGRWFAGYGAADAVPLMGDSYVSEAVGIGAFAMASAPAIAGFIGGRASDLVEHSVRMYAITVREHPIFTIPFLNYRGTPVGIDAERVVQSAIVPILNTGIAGRHPGVGQIGAGVATPPLACFVEACERLAG